MTQFWLPGDSDFALAMREPNLLVPGKKPIGRVVLDRSSPLVNGLIGDWSLFEGTGNFVDLTGNTIPSLGTGTWVHGSTGPAINYGTVSGSQNSPLGTFSAFPNGNAPFSIFFEWEGTWNGEGYLFGIGENVLSRQRALGFRGSAQQLTFFSYANNAYSNVTTITGRNVWGFTYDGTTASFYRNGIAIGSGSLGGGSLGTFTTYAAYIGYAPFKNGYGTVHWMKVWNKALAQTDIALLQKEWRLMRPANDAPYLINVPAGGGTPTLSSPGVINVQSDRATPQVTLTF